MNRFLAMLSLTCAAVGLQIAVFMQGWGMTPKNWWWIIGGGVFGFVVLRSLYDAASKEAPNAAP